jgi:hypothetical protein
MTNKTQTPDLTITRTSLIAESALAQTPASSGATAAPQIDTYMGAPVELVKAHNGAIARKKLVDGIDKVGCSKPTIEQPAEGIWVFGG